MKEITVEEIVSKNQTFIMLLGYATSIIFSLQSIIDESGGCYDENLLDKIGWFKQAIENIIYKNIPAPKIP